MKLKVIITYVAEAKDRVSHQLLLVKMAILTSQRDHAWHVVCAEEDGQCKHKMSTNENLIVVVAELM